LRAVGATPMSRRFPPPWTIEETNVVSDSDCDLTV
jgi:hypothetical protein